MRTGSHLQAPLACPLFYYQGILRANGQQKVVAVSMRLCPPILRCFATKAQEYDETCFSYVQLPVGLAYTTPKKWVRRALFYAIKDYCLTG